MLSLQFLIYFFILSIFYWLCLHIVKKSRKTFQNTFVIISSIAIEFILLTLIAIFVYINKDINLPEDATIAYSFIITSFSLLPAASIALFYERISFNLRKYIQNWAIKFIFFIFYIAFISFYYIVMLYPKVILGEDWGSLSGDLIGPLVSSVLSILPYFLSKTNAKVCIKNYSYSNLCSEYKIPLTKSFMEVYVVNTGSNELGFRLLGFSESIDVDAIFKKERDWEPQLILIPDLNYKSGLIKPHNISRIYKINIKDLSKELKKGYILFANDLGNIYYTGFDIEDANK